MGLGGGGGGGGGGGSNVLSTHTLNFIHKIIKVFKNWFLIHENTAACLGEGKRAFLYYIVILKLNYVILDTSRLVCRFQSELIVKADKSWVL